MGIFLVFLILIVITALLLIVVIMVQNPKGGGLDSTFGGGGTMIGGVKQTTDFLEKATWTLFGIMVGLILLSNTVVFTQKNKKPEIVTPETVEQPKQAEQQAPLQPTLPVQQGGQNQAPAQGK